MSALRVSPPIPAPWGWAFPRRMAWRGRAASRAASGGVVIARVWGRARARRCAGRGGRIVVMTGDGELQEGQIWESLQPIANERLAGITAGGRAPQEAA